MSISETAIEFRLFKLDTLDIHISKTTINIAIKQPFDFLGFFGTSSAVVFSSSGSDTFSVLGCSGSVSVSSSL